VEEDSLIFCICVRSLALSVKVVDSYIFKLTVVTSAAKCVNQYFRGTGNTAEMDMVSGLYIFYSLISADKFNVVHFKSIIMC
jgi:hypothetical protein